MATSPPTTSTKAATTLRICLLTPQDLDADPFPSDDWPNDPRPYLPEATWHVETVAKPTSARAVTRLVKQGGFDLFFNLCSGAADEDMPGIEVARALERHGVPFVGPAAAFHEPTRARMKRACRAAGIPTPAHVFVRDEAGIARAAARLRFPLIVKHHSSYASVSLSRASRVCSPAGLARQAHKILARHGAALVEEFVEGTECTVLVAEHPHPGTAPTTFTPIQYRFPAGETFKHENLKWVDYDGLDAHPVEDPLLAARLRGISARFFTAVGGNSFARCDIRVDGTGQPWMLEINPNCGVYYPPDAAGSADLCLQHDPAGHEGFTRQLVAAALRRHARRRRQDRRSDAA
ncbi:MAG: D-alanine--D-alanine ligase [Candidatus Krumholzibacteriia bacterium]